MPDMTNQTTPPQAYRAVMARVAAASAAGAQPTVIAVSKTHSAERIIPLLEAGQRHFGENRVQEAAAKWPGLRALYPDIALHLIGPLQTNKVKAAVELFDCIHSLDRPSLAKALASEFGKQGRSLPLFIQVNTGEEEQKAGIAPLELAGFYRWCTEALHLPVTGLMCIPPVDEDPEPHFTWLAEQASKLGLPHLSMGMSGDFEMAIRHGATHVRIGSALFGERA